MFLFLACLPAFGLDGKVLEMDVNLCLLDEADRLENEEPLDWPTRLNIAIGTARGIAYLHHDCIPHIIHRDIKASNILLDEDMEAHVADFGLAKLLSPDRTHVTTVMAGTFGYLAPGILSVHFDYILPVFLEIGKSYVSHTF